MSFLPLVLLLSNYVYVHSNGYRIVKQLLPEIFLQLPRGVQLPIRSDQTLAKRLISLINLSINFRNGVLAYSTSIIIESVA